MKTTERETVATRRSKPDVLAQLAAYQREKQLAPLRETQQQLARTLDDLNAFGALETVRAKRFSPHLCCGPAARAGLIPDPWVGVMIWHRPSGYLGYKTLTLLGVWAKVRQDVAEIHIGVRRLAFAAPFYDPEAYVKLIPRAFDLYYNDPGSPPAAPALSFSYDAVQRLEQRERVERMLVDLAE